MCCGNCENSSLHWIIECHKSSVLGRSTLRMTQRSLEPVTKPQVAIRRVGASMRIPKHYATFQDYSDVRAGLCD